MSYVYVNMDRKLIKKGGRKAVRISEEELLKKIYKLYAKSEEYFDEDVTEENFDETYHLNTEVFIENKTIEKDLSKINFCYDNFIASKQDLSKGNNALVGFNTLENGLTFFGVIDSGDNECSLFYIIYFDGKNLRGYIPTYGNRFNNDLKTAFRGENIINAYLKKYSIKGEYKEVSINWEAIKEDIINRIILK